MKSQVTRRSIVWLVVFLCLSAVTDGIVSLTASTTTDEVRHLDYGLKILRLDPDHATHGFYDSQMPVTAFNAISLIVATHLSGHPLPRGVPLVFGHFRAARLPTILATLLLTVFIFLWSYDLYGEAAACASCVLCMLSPNLIAHGTLITTDMYHALGVVGSLYFVRRFLIAPTTENAVIGGLALALAQITKSFALVLYPVIFFAIAAVLLYPGIRKSLTPKRLLVFAATSACSFVVVMNLVYSFDRTFMPLDHYSVQTTEFALLKKALIIGRLPVPVPYPFLQGLDLTKESEETGRTYGDTYLLGELRNPLTPDFRPFKSYFVVAWFYKEPIALQILFAWGLVWIVRNRRLKDLLRGEGLLLGTAAILIIWLSFFDAAQIGIRHVLPALAVEVIIAAAAFSNFPTKPLPIKITLVALVLWMAASVGSYYPQMIPYMNEWVHDRRFSYQILSDSNLDWGQDQGIVTRYLRDNPDVVLDPRQPVTGRVLVRADRLTGVYRWDTCCAYLMKQYKPVAEVGYAHFLFVIPSNEKAGAH